MKKIGIIGHFGGDKEFFDGQTIKTKNLHRALKEALGDDAITCVDTYEFHNKSFFFFFKAVKLIFTSKNLIMLPDENGVRVLMPFYCIMNFFLRRKLHYDVIGGWLPGFLKKHRITAWFAKRIAGIYVETTTMKKSLEQMGFDNIVLLPNFKHLVPLKKENVGSNESRPHKLCIFSRIMEQKGIEDAIHSVTAINENRAEIVYELDIYGQIDSGYTQRFAALQETFPSYIRYLGIVDPEKSVEVLKDYFALLFPTRFFTEGIPGTIIDAYAAGVPVISARWESFADVVDHEQTGYGYEFGSNAALTQLLTEIADAPAMITGLKKNCLKKAQDYMPAKAIEILQQRMEG